MSQGKKTLRFIISIFIITIGAIIAAATLELVLIPNKMIDGGINGISIILDTIFGGALGLYVILINLPFVLFGAKKLGGKFLFKTAYGMILFSILLEVFGHFDPLIDDTLLATVYGGIALGIGVGLIIKEGGCLDGTETVAIIMSRKNNMSVGQIVFVMNIFIYGAAIFVFGADRALYSLLTYFVTYKVIDMVSEGMNSVKAALIITDDADEIATNIMGKLGRTVTTMEGMGFVSKNNMTILYTVITKYELSMLKDILNEADASSFVTISDVSEVIGKHIKKIPNKVIEKWNN